jgi:hypothetical protein
MTQPKRTYDPPREETTGAPWWSGCGHALEGSAFSRRRAV